MRGNGTNCRLVEGQRRREGFSNQVSQSRAELRRGKRVDPRLHQLRRRSDRHTWPDQTTCDLHHSGLDNDSFDSRPACCELLGKGGAAIECAARAHAHRVPIALMVSSCHSAAILHALWTAQPCELNEMGLRG